MPQSRYRDAYEVYNTGSGPSRRAQHRGTVSTSVSDDDYSDAEDKLPESSSLESVKSDDIEVVSLEPQHDMLKGKGNRSRDQHSGDHASGSDGPVENKTIFWPSLDLSVVVALVSPIGSWLTGGDHIKNLIVVVLLVFYLHQIIEIPWKLYNASRPRRPARPQTGDSTFSPLAELARSELHKHELFYLFLTILSPFLGVYLLRIVLASAGGAHAISWFSTTLFVLATGVRPWMHLISRLRGRAQDLHDVIHQHTPALDTEWTNMTHRVDTLEEELRTTQRRLAHAERIKEAYEDMSAALADIERNVRRHERQMNATKTAQDLRLATLEATLAERRLRDWEERTPRRTTISYPPVDPRPYLTVASTVLAKIPHIFWIRAVDPELGKSPPSSTSYQQLEETVSLRPSRSHGPSHTARLATIPEAEDSDSEGTYVSEKEITQTKVHNSANVKGRNVSRSRTRLQRRSQQSYIWMAMDLVAWPCRTALGVVLTVLSSLRDHLPQSARYL